MNINSSDRFVITELNEDGTHCSFFKLNFAFIFHENVVYFSSSMFSKKGKRYFNEKNASN
jgi:hypothetical protein